MDYVPKLFANRLPQSIANMNIPQNIPNQNGNISLANIRSPNVPLSKPTPLPSASTGPPTGRAKWGPPVWTLFHSLAEKVRPEYFSAIRMDILNMIHSICVNLPCPECATHATKYMDSLNFNLITTKEDLKNMLFHFHNSVNLRKGTPAFDYSELNTKYSAANIYIVIQKFMEVFAVKNYSIRMISNDFHKNRAIVQIKKWFVKNIQYFDN
jgi:hypothetical protein